MWVPRKSYLMNLPKAIQLYLTSQKPKSGPISLCAQPPICYLRPAVRSWLHSPSQPAITVHHETMYVPTSRTLRHNTSHRNPDPNPRNQPSFARFKPWCPELQWSLDVGSWSFHRYAAQNSRSFGKFRVLFPALLSEAPHFSDIQ